MKVEYDEYITIGNEKHRIGDKKCSKCKYGTTECECGGLLHSVVIVKECYVGWIDISYFCDNKNCTERKRK